MIATLRESKARLSELVALANSGEEVLITVHGQPKARLLSVSESLTDTAAWLRGLEKFRSSLGQPAKKPKRTALDEVREDRW
jgi:prevent-host-death family protein